LKGEAFAIIAFRHLFVFLRDLPGSLGSLRILGKFEILKVDVAAVNAGLPCDGSYAQYIAKIMISGSSSIRKAAYLWKPAFANKN